MIHLEKSLSDESKSSTFYENMFNSARCLTHQTLWLLFLFLYERVSKPCMTNAQSGYNDLFSIFWKLVSILPKRAGFGRVYCGCYYSSMWRNLSILGFKSVYGILKLSGVRSEANLAAESALSFPLPPMWLGIQYIRISLQFDIESSLVNS